MEPRATSRHLVAAARALVGEDRARVADVGTGSGAIAIAIATACSNAEVWATDVSRSAVLLARANVRRHGLSGRVFVREGDLLAPVPGPLDVVVANLPYLPASTAAAHPELEREPFAAVFVGGDGLDAYRRLVAAVATRLAGNGVLLLQLDGRLVTAARQDLPALAAALGTSRLGSRGARVEEIAGTAARLCPRTAVNSSPDSRPAFPLNGARLGPMLPKGRAAPAAEMGSRPDGRRARAPRHSVVRERRRDECIDRLRCRRLG
jgi:methylase of polypeptide subunit release factors